jgi:hypothetical protein
VNLELEKLIENVQRVVQAVVSALDESKGVGGKTKVNTAPRRA